MGSKRGRKMYRKQDTKEEELYEEPEESPPEEVGVLNAEDDKPNLEEDTWEDEEELDDSG